MKQVTKRHEDYLIIYRNESGGYSLKKGFFFSKANAEAEADKLDGAEVYKRVSVPEIPLEPGEIR